MTLPIVFSPRYDAGFPPHHRFPMEKYSRLITLLRREDLLTANNAFEPKPAPADWLALAHDPAYVDQVIACTVPAAIERHIGFPVSPRVAQRARMATAGTVMAARLALETGLSCNTAGGSHHARHAHGAGFCTFNDVGVAARVLIASGEIERALVVDLDVHQGDGTAELFADDDRVFTVSIHAEKNYPVRKMASDIDVGLPDGVRDDAYIEVVEDTLARALAAFSPNLVFYNAGVDPHAEDRLGRLSLSREGLWRRERTVIGFFRQRGIALCGVVGGGYSRDIEALADRHAILFRVARSLA